MLIADVIDRDDVGVVQSASDLRLIDEALDGNCLLLARFGQKLDGHVAVQRRVFGFINRRHAARADKARDGVLAKALTQTWIATACISGIRRGCRLRAFLRITGDRHYLHHQDLAPADQQFHASARVFDGAQR